MVTLFLVFTFKISAPETEGLTNKIDSFTSIVFEKSITSYQNNYKDVLKKYPELWPDPLMTTDELIYYLNVTGHSENATQLVESLAEMLLPEFVGISYKINDYEIYSRGTYKKEKSENVISNKKITYKLLTNTQVLGPSLTEVSVWQ